MHLKKIKNWGDLLWTTDDVRNDKKKVPCYMLISFFGCWGPREKREHALFVSWKQILTQGVNTAWCTALVHSPRPVLTERAALEARRCLHRRRRRPRWRRPWTGWSWTRSPVLRFFPWVDRGDGRPPIVQTIAGRGKQKSENYLMVISWPKENRFFCPLHPP